VRFRTSFRAVAVSAAARRRSILELFAPKKSFLVATAEALLVEARNVRAEGRFEACAAVVEAAVGGTSYDLAVFVARIAEWHE